MHQRPRMIPNLKAGNSCLLFITETLATPSRTVYKIRTWIKVNFNHLFLLINYKLYVLKIILLETSFEYKFNDIIFIIYILLFVAKIGDQYFS
jgi:hypothetical protein